MRNFQRPADVASKLLVVGGDLRVLHTRDRIRLGIENGVCVAVVKTEPHAVHLLPEQPSASARTATSWTSAAAAASKTASTPTTAGFASGTAQACSRNLLPDGEVRISSASRPPETLIKTSRRAGIIIRRQTLPDGALQQERVRGRCAARPRDRRRGFLTAGRLIRSHVGLLKSAAHPLRDSVEKAGRKLLTATSSAGIAISGLTVPVLATVCTRTRLAGCLAALLLGPGGSRRRRKLSERSDAKNQLNVWLRQPGDLEIYSGGLKS